MTPVLNTANAVKLGSQSPSGVRLGSVPIWTPGSPQLTLTQVAADNFNRGNGGLGGSNGWVATADGNPVIAANELSGVGASIAGAYRTDAHSGDQFAQGAVGSVNNVANDFVGLTLRHNVSTNAEYAMLYYINGSTPVLNFYYRTAPGAYTQIGGQSLPGAGLPAGTVLQFYAIGNVLVGLVNGVQQLALIDTHIPSGGTPGVTTFGTMTLDNFACGNASMGSALGAAIATDNFNRANGNASAGQAGWTPVTASFSGVASTDGTIVSNELNISGSSGHHTAQRNEAYSPDQWAQIGMGSTPPPTGSGAFVGVILRWNGTKGYMFCYFLNVPVSYRIYFIQAGQSSIELGAGCPAHGSISNPTGSVYTGVAKGSRLSIRLNTCEVFSVTDSQATAGQPGYQCYPTCTADNFAAGSA